MASATRASSIHHPEPPQALTERQRRYAIRVSPEPALPTFDTPKGTGLPFDQRLGAFPLVGSPDQLAASPALGANSDRRLPLRVRGAPPSRPWFRAVQVPHRATGRDHRAKYVVPRPSPSSSRSHYAVSHGEAQIRRSPHPAR